ncbi:MAG: geranyl transferase [Sulfurovum sp. PC08-66]|nr:MAG: geranyl transferase [Sulfurovum sp. PC08-66]KIM12533.1 MAG: geranyl transferase [Sulfuricurvum sp. PC08-66]
MIEKFELFLHHHLPHVESVHPHFNTAMATMMQCGGKRFRPALLLSVVEAYTPLLREAAMGAALSIECLHTYSLIHDDLPAMDNAALRRGVPTLHVTYDETTAILVGDALNTYAFELLSTLALSAFTRIELVKLLAHNGGLSGMIIGQAVDCFFEQKRLDLETLRELHRNKTAKLIAASLEMGAVIANREDLRAPLYAFGLDLGLLFQIQDDILDQTQTPEQAGKTTQNDGDKNSFVNLLTLEGAMQEATQLADSLRGQLNSFEAPLQRALVTLLDTYLYRHKEMKPS